jgi:hypothetical protein
MAGDSALAEKEFAGDLTVRTPLDNQGGDAALGRRQARLPRAAADPAELAARLLDPGGRPELLEALEGGTDRVASRPLLPKAPAGDAQRKLRASPAEGISDRLVLGDRMLEERSGPTDVPAGGGHETAAPRHVREHPLVAEPYSAFFPEVDNSYRVVEPVEL